LYQIYKLGGSFEVWPYWDILDLTTPQGLLNCIFFYNGKNLCLRGGEEHRKLTFSQLKRETTTVNGVQKNCYIYTAHGSKNRSGGLRQLHLPNKVVRHFEVPEAGEKDYVRMLDLYISKVPADAIKKDIFISVLLLQLKENHDFQVFL
jgi:hypothetical protein